MEQVLVYLHQYATNKYKCNIKHNKTSESVHVVAHFTCEASWCSLCALRHRVKVERFVK